MPDDSDETDDEGQDKKQKAVLKVSLTNSNVHTYTRDLMYVNTWVYLFLEHKNCQSFLAL